jgi:hypothetical protein
MTARGVLNDAVSIYFAEATLASAFVARWCIRAKVETAGGAFQVRDDAPEARVGAGPHRTHPVYPIVSDDPTISPKLAKRSL